MTDTILKVFASLTIVGIFGALLTNRQRFIDMGVIAGAIFLLILVWSKI